MLSSKLINSYWDRRLVAETVNRATLTFQRIDDVEGRHRLALSVLAIERRILHDLFEEHAEGATGLVVDQTRQSLHATTTRHAADGRLCDALDVLVDDLGVALRALRARLSF